MDGGEKPEVSLRRANPRTRGRRCNNASRERSTPRRQRLSLELQSSSISRSRQIKLLTQYPVYSYIKDDPSCPNNCLLQFLPASPRNSARYAVFLAKENQRRVHIREYRRNSNHSLAEPIKITVEFGWKNLTQLSRIMRYTREMQIGCTYSVLWEWMHE